MAKGCGCALLILLVAGVAIWFLVRDAGGGIAKRAEATRAEGQKHGAGLDEKGCLDESIERHRKPENQNLTASLHEGFLLQGCLEGSRATPGFCDGVPSGTNPIEGGLWLAARCKAAGLSDTYCSGLFKAVMYFCISPEHQHKKS
jgi:hypothetical protein